MKKIIIYTFSVILTITAQAQPKSNYYTSSTLDGKYGRDLELALQKIVYPHSHLDYSYLWTAFTITDLAPADSVPAGSKKTDLVYDMYAFMRVCPNYYSDNNHSTTGFNREHSMPNSWWGGESGNSVAYTDLHHLTPSNYEANNRKSNYPLGYSSGKPSYTNGSCNLWPVSSSNDGMGGGAAFVWEPNDEYKGDFARAYLYVVCAYEKYLQWQYKYMFTNNSEGYTDIKDWALQVLLKWSREDPISPKELERNNAVESVQGNRNPFIDYPELVEYIWGDKSTSTTSGSGFSLKDATLSYSDDYQNKYEQEDSSLPKPQILIAHYAKINSEFNAPVLSNSGNGTVTYSSSDSSIADVDSETGKITLKGIGSVIITATSSETNLYNQATARYLLVVTE